MTFVIFYVDKSCDQCQYIIIVDDNQSMAATAGLRKKGMDNYLTKPKLEASKMAKITLKGKRNKHLRRTTCSRISGP